MTKDDLEGLIRYINVLPEVGNSAKEKLFSIKGRLAKLESDRVVGILSQDDYLKERNQIRYGLIQIITTLEEKITKIEKNKEQQKKIFSFAKKYSVFVIGGIVLLFLGKTIYNYISFTSSINLPYKYIGEVVSKEKVDELFQELEKDSTLGSDFFNDKLKHLYSISRDKQHFIDINEYDSARVNQIFLPEKDFVSKTSAFYKKLTKEAITFDQIYLEGQYITELREEILIDSINKEYQLIDKYCVEIQNYIDEKFNIAEKIKSLVEVELLNVKINKYSKRLEGNLRVENGLAKILYSVNSVIFIVDRYSKDTLTFMRALIDEPSGIETVYKQPEGTSVYWNQSSVYEKIKNYKERDLYFFGEIIEVNVEGEIYNLLGGYRPQELPYDGYFRKNESYSTPGILTGECPYLPLYNKIIQDSEDRINDLVTKFRQEKGYYYTDHVNGLNLRRN